MNKTDTWQGYSRQELAQVREASLQNIRCEIDSLCKGIDTARQNKMTKTMDIVKRLAKITGYIELLGLGFKILRMIRKFKG